MIFNLNLDDMTKGSAFSLKSFINRNKSLFSGRKKNIAGERARYSEDFVFGTEENRNSDTANPNSPCLIKKSHYFVEYF